MVKPTIVTGLTDSSKLLCEIFGPVVAVLPFDTESEVIAGRTTTATASTRWCSPNLTRAHRVAAKLNAGTVWVNCGRHADQPRVA